MDDFLDFLGVLLLFVVIAGFGMGGSMYGISYLMSSSACENYGKITGANTRFTKQMDCYIEVDNEFVHWEILKRRNIAKDVNK